MNIMNFLLQILLSCFSIFNEFVFSFSLLHPTLNSLIYIEQLESQYRSMFITSKPSTISPDELLRWNIYSALCLYSNTNHVSVRGLYLLTETSLVFWKKFGERSWKTSGMLYQQGYLLSLLIDFSSFWNHDIFLWRATCAHIYPLNQ